MTTVTKAVAAREAAPAPTTPAAAIKGLIDHYRPVILKLLRGTGINEETFVAQIANACRATPKLWECTPPTVLGAALRCAQLGLAPNDVRNLAWIIPYGHEATFQLGYGGVMELARRAVPGLKFDGRAVYPNDKFDVDFGADPPLRHRPHYALGLDRGGDARAWYVRARYPDGDELIHALDRAGVEYHRGYSKQPDGLMWTKAYDAAALKSVVLDMKRWLPSSAQLVAALASDEQVYDVEHPEALEVAEVESLPEPEEGPPPEPSSGSKSRRSPRAAEGEAGGDDMAPPASPDAGEGEA